MNYETLNVLIKKNIAYITLNRPERLNSVDMKLGIELYTILKNIIKKNKTRAVIIKGMGEVFCGGLDVKEMHKVKDKPKFFREFIKEIHRCVLEMKNMKKPVKAAINDASFDVGLSNTLAYAIIQLNTKW